MSGTRPLQRVIFSNKPLEGFIEVQGHFKIFPVHQWVNLNKSQIFHQDIPPFDRLWGEVGPPFPLHIEVDVPASPELEWYRNGLRILDRYEKLAAFFVPGLSLASHVNNVTRWTALFDNSSKGPSFSYAITQFGFSVEGDGGFDRYLREGGIPAKPFEGEGDFYDSLLTAKALEFPANLVGLLTSYSNLPAKRRADFDRSVFLFQQGEYLRQSRFEPLVSYVAAVECLLKKESESCAHCGQKKYGIGKKFESFMVAFASVSEAVLNDRKKMYSVRSKAVHGVHVRRVDRDESQSSFDMNDFLFPWLVRRGIVNWLLSMSKHV